MTYADRGTVADLLTEGRLPLERVVPIVMQAGDGLAVLHARGVVHRDIKPQNLLLASDGLGRERVMVADLGVAKALIHASGLTQVVGTPAYMAPEQAIGGGIDERADVHGLAAVAYHLLTGHVARSGGVRDLTTAKLPPPPSAFVEVSPDVDEAILRGLEPDRDDRWPDIASFVEALTAAAPEAVPTTTVLGLRPQPPARPRRRPSSELPAVLLAVLCLVVALAMFGASYAVVSMLE
jgi:serine/threonine protein kinase